MIKNVTIYRPSSHAHILSPVMFMPPNSSQHFIEIDYGLKNKTTYHQTNFCYFLHENIYYQQLTEIQNDNITPDELKILVLTGEIDNSNNHFELEIENVLPVDAKINTNYIQLGFYPQDGNYIVIRDETARNCFYHFKSLQAIYRMGKKPLLKLRYLNLYGNNNVVQVLRGWHICPIEHLHNIILL